MNKKKYNYTGEKKITSIRLSDDEKTMIQLKGFGSVQEFVQFSLNNIELLKKKGDNDGLYSDGK